MNIAILGANGFIGRNLSSELVARGNSVWAVVHKRADHIPVGCSIISVADLRNIDITFDVVYVSVGNYRNSLDELTLISEEVEGYLKQLVFRKVVLISSTSVYGNSQGRLNRNPDTREASEYAKGKLILENVVSRFLNHVILRLTYVYGVGMNSGSLIPVWIQSAINKSEIIVHGRGDRFQDYLHISDVVSLSVRAGVVDVEGAFIGASGSETTNRELAELIQRRFANCVIRHTNADSTNSYAFDIEDTKVSFNWRPTMPFETGINELIDYEMGNLL